MYTVMFRGEKRQVKFSRYQTGNNLALMLIAEDGDRMVASVNLVGYNPPPGHVWIKNWSENKGILKVLVDEGIVEDTGTEMETGFVAANLCKVLIPVEG